jgi:hypothetical protein
VSMRVKRFPWCEGLEQQTDRRPVFVGPPGLHN